MKISELLKPIKATKENLKIGDFVYYNPTRKRYCIVTKIEIEFEKLKVWGKWTDDKELKTGKEYSDTYTTSDVYIIRRTK